VVGAFVKRDPPPSRCGWSIIAEAQTMGGGALDNLDIMSFAKECGLKVVDMFAEEKTVQEAPAKLDSACCSMELQVLAAGERSVRIQLLVRQEDVEIA